MIIFKGILRKHLLFVMFVISIFSMFITPANSQTFTIVFQKDFSLTSKDGIVTYVEGDLQIKNDKNEIIAEGKAQINEGLVSLRGKKGASFEYDPSTAKIDNKWSDKEPSEFANINVQKNHWTIENDRFFFLLYSQPMGSSPLNILLPESIIRASILTLPKGNYDLFGYKFNATKDGAKVTFLKGIIVGCTNCDQQSR